MKNTIYRLITLTVCISSCTKTNTIPDRTTIIPVSYAYVKAMQMSPDAPLFNVMVDSIRAITVLETSPNVESGIAFGAVVPSTADGYSVVIGGARTISAKVTSVSTTFPGQTIVSKTTNLAQGKYYTMAFVDSLSRLDAVIIEDDLNVPDTSKAYFRIANFMLNGAADVEFVSTAGGNNFMKNGIAFKNASNFETLTPATYSKIYLRSNGSTTKLDSIQNFIPIKGRKYTLYTRGVVGQTGSTNTKRPLLFQITTL
jgi:hypothetical protein